MTIPTEILDAVAGYYGMSRGDLIGPRRWPRIIRARRVAMAIMREVLGMSYPEIGHAIGHRHHTTVIHALRGLTADPELVFDRDAIIKLMAREGSRSDVDLFGRAAARRDPH